uniref:Beta-lactamase/transpeptidase-like protein n=1 Tax=Tanacetum cinerariifolium TaxID=118510 RepID=A0A6L2LJU9_TANCI|nr:beta-lactamase/transpeptidase-like protein [Tanacetum cinerariifolium]
MFATLIPLCNTLNARRAIQPAANGHFSAHAVARYYATLVDPTFPSKEIFTSFKAKLHDAFLGSEDYKDLVLQNGMFVLEFKKVEFIDGSVIGFGHAGLGGSTAYCDIYNRLANSVTINKLSLDDLTGEIIRFIYSELDLPVPQDYVESRDFIEEPKIN